MTCRCRGRPNCLKLRRLQTFRLPHCPESTRIDISAPLGSSFKHSEDEHSRVAEFKDLQSKFSSNDESTHLPAALFEQNTRLLFLELMNSKFKKRRSKYKTDLVSTCY